MMPGRNQHMVYVIIPVHNRCDMTSECLTSLSKQSYRNFTTIVIDDGSTDNTSNIIRGNFPEVVMLKGDGDLWWTGATNLGVKYALAQADKNDYILTLNNDTVVHGDYIETLLNCASEHQRSLIGSISVSKEDESVVIDAGVRINWLIAKYTNMAVGRSYPDILQGGPSIQKVDVLPGRGTLIPAEVFRQVGLYDFKRLPHYNADYEFSHRAKMNGYNLLINYEAIVISWVETTGLDNRVRSMKWDDLVRSFFTIRSVNNLRYRWNYARLCCPGWRFPVFYMCDTLRLIIGSLMYQTRLRNRL